MLKQRPDDRVIRVAPPPSRPGHGALPRGRRLEIWNVLNAASIDADAVESQALAGVLATAFEMQGVRRLPLAVLDVGSTRRLLDHWFPGVDRELDLDWHALAADRAALVRHDELVDLVALLIECASTPAGAMEQAHWIAHAIAQGCMGENHLWQDLHLPSRSKLSLLIGRWFPRIAQRNSRDMKWKKFFYKQLCERAEISICRAPSCGVCSDFARCFGPEVGPAG